LSKMWEPTCLQVLRRNYAAWVASVMAVWKFWLERSGCSIRWREMYCSLPLDIVSFFIDLCIESHSQNAGGGFGKKIVQDIYRRHRAKSGKRSEWDLNMSWKLVAGHNQSNCNNPSDQHFVNSSLLCSGHMNTESSFTNPFTSKLCHY
jgi:hypothetical protein